MGAFADILDYNQYAEHVWSMSEEEMREKGRFKRQAHQIITDRDALEDVLKEGVKQGVKQGVSWVLKNPGKAFNTVMKAKSSISRIVTDVRGKGTWNWSDSLFKKSKAQSYQEQRRPRHNETTIFDEEILHKSSANDLVDQDL